MKIISMKKVKLGQYELLFDNGSKTILYEDVIVNNNLINKEIDNKLYEELLGENEIAQAEYETIKYIARKIRSEKEIREFLKSKTDDIEMIEKVIIKLKKLKLVDDNLFASSYAKDKYNINKYGINKIRRGLEEHNIEEEMINNATSFISDEDQLNRIKKIVERYLLANKKDALIKLKNKIYVNLIDRGYPKELIYEVINQINLNDNKVIKKQYDKLYKKYSLKYSGEELSKMISKSLQKQGFTYEEIKNLEN